MKKILLIAIVALSLGSCKKTSPAPVEPCVTTVNNNVGVHIWIESLASTPTGSLTGVLEFKDNSDTLNSLFLFSRPFNVSNATKFTYDTVFNLNAPDINVLTYLASQSSTGIDNACDTQIKVWFDGQLKYWGAGATILNLTDIK